MLDYHITSTTEVEVCYFPKHGDPSRWTGSAERTFKGGIEYVRMGKFDFAWLDSSEATDAGEYGVGGITAVDRSLSRRRRRERDLHTVLARHRTRDTLDEADISHTEHLPDGVHLTEHGVRLDDIFPTTCTLSMSS